MSSNPTVKDEVARLTALIEEQGRVLEEQRRRLEVLEHHGDNGANGSGNGNENGDTRHSRRELLRLAGIAAAGAAGAAGVTALQALPAAAASGGNFVLGQSNNADASTVLNPTAAVPSSANVPGLLDVDGSTGPGGAVVATANFFRALRGEAPTTPANNPVSGVGVWGGSDAGAAVIGSSLNGVDLWAFNSGRVMQSAQAAGAPTYQGGVYDATNAVWTDFEIIRDDNGLVWVFVPPSLAGNNIAPTGPSGGNWIPLQTGGLGQTLFTVVSNKQYGLTGSQGTTFVDMVPLGGGTPDLTMTITPAFNCYAILSGNVDLFTSAAGNNQDIGIYVSPSSATQNIVAWKESGGFAGTFSPNAAFVQTVFPMTRGTAYTVKLQWKTNKAQTGSIYAGAGPWPSGSGLGSPTRLTALLVINP